MVRFSRFYGALKFVQPPCLYMCFCCDVVLQAIATGEELMLIIVSFWVAEDFMLCKSENRDPAHCLKEGRRVTRCATDLCVSNTVIMAKASAS